MNNITKFADYCKSEFECGNVGDCGVHIQDYADHLNERGLSPDTIHTYLAPVCRVYHLSMREIKKPLRIGAEATKSRGTPKVDSRSDAMDSASPRLAAFADAVGIRRAEYGQLRGRNFKQDESGYWCVEVECGKGGKYQLQRLAPEDVEFVRSYFEGLKPDDFVFKKSELANKIDLHAKRGANARRKYEGYLKAFSDDPKARWRTYQEIKARWKIYNKKSNFPSWGEINKPYFLRSGNRNKAIEKGLPIKYDRLALFAVSVFHLSHWRVDDTVTSYVLG